MAHVIYCFPLANEEVLNEDDLVDIIDALDEDGFASSDWYRLGIHLRIKTNDLKTIQYDFRDKATACLVECLVKWLKTGKATYTGLAEALKRMGVDAAADYISEYWHHCKVKFPNLFKFLPQESKRKKSRQNVVYRSR